jgi:type IV pilus assembly protein PilC
MAMYSYTAVNRAGKETRGTIETDSREKAAGRLKEDGLTILSLTESGALNKDVNLDFLSKKPSPRDMAVFCRQFTSIINAGVSVVSALEMLGDQTENSRLRSAIVQCKVDIEKGESLANAMRKHPQVFPDLFITMVDAGESSGSLDVSFTRLAQQFEKSAALHATVKKASIYPIVVVTVAIGVVIAMLTFVIPTFEQMFADLGTDLPGITNAVIAVAGFIRTKWFILLAVIIGLVVSIGTFKRSDAGKHFFGKLARKLPIIKNLTVKSASASMARTLSTLLAAGISLTDALEITSRVMTNVFFKEALMTAHDDVSMGNALSETIKRSGVFPPLVYHMLSIGEDTGDLGGMLDNLAGYYEDEVQQATQQLMAALEPMIIILLALVVGTIIISVIMPMAKMYTALDSL